MTLKSALLIGLSSVIAYKTYQHKDELLAIAKNSKKQKDNIQYDLEKIKTNLAVISSETHKIQKMSDDITYRLRVFNAQTQPLFMQIKEHMEKYQSQVDEQ
ncbi:chemotaxis protein [Streptococcus iniae]